MEIKTRELVFINDEMKRVMAEDARLPTEKKSAQKISEKIEGELQL